MQGYRVGVSDENQYVVALIIMHLKARISFPSLLEYYEYQNMGTNPLHPNGIRNSKRTLPVLIPAMGIHDENRTHQRNISILSINPYRFH